MTPPSTPQERLQDSAKALYRREDPAKAAEVLAMRAAARQAAGEKSSSSTQLLLDDTIAETAGVRSQAATVPTEEAVVLKREAAKEDAAEADCLGWPELLQKSYESRMKAASRCWNGSRCGGENT